MFILFPSDRDVKMEYKTLKEKQKEYNKKKLNYLATCLTG